MIVNSPCNALKSDQVFIDLYFSISYTYIENIKNIMGMIKLETIDEIESFVQLIRSQLPSASISTDELMLERGYEAGDNLFYLWIEALADVTNDFIQKKNEQEVIKHLAFFSCQFEKTSEKAKKFIELGYVENLMWNSPGEHKKWAWPLFPENLKCLYAAMWGNPYI